jgi:hypothetical protein
VTAAAKSILSSAAHRGGLIAALRVTIARPAVVPAALVATAARQNKEQTTAAAEETAMMMTVPVCQLDVGTWLNDPSGTRVIELHRTRGGCRTDGQPASS